jgi:hypothetical protein
MAPVDCYLLVSTLPIVRAPLSTLTLAATYEIFTAPAVIVHLKPPNRQTQLQPSMAHTLNYPPWARC